MFSQVSLASGFTLRFDPLIKYQRVAVFLLMLFMVSATHAQTYLNSTGVPTFATPAPVESGFVNLSNGNLHLEIDLGAFPQRGKTMYTAKLVYDGRIWQVVNGTWQPSNVANSQGGWRFVTTADPGTVTQTSTSTVCNGAQVIQTWQNFTWTDPIGTQRIFPITTTQNQCTGVNTSSGDAYAQDSSGFHMYVTNFTSATVFAKNGNQLFPIVEDTNGNYFSTDGNGNTVDMLNRTPVTKTVNGSTIFYDVLNSQGGTSRFTVTTTTVNVNTAFGQTGATEYSGSFDAVQSIGFPDGTNYSFSYDSGTTSGFYGLLASMTLRTGGQVTYTWTNFSDGFGNVNRWLKTRHKSGTWTYSPVLINTCAPGTTGCQQQVALTKPSGDQIYYTFTLNNGAWNVRTKYFNGNSGTGTLLKTVTKDYDFSNACPLAGCFGNAYIRVIRSTTTAPVPSGNVIKKTEYGYDSTNFGNFSAVKEWNYYTGTPAATPDRETDYVYLTTSSYASKDIHDRVTSITITNAAGGQLAQTLTTYDSGALTSVGGITHNDDTNFGTGNTVRGNSTQVQRWVSGTAYLTTSMTYDTTGQMLTRTNPRGHTHTYVYTDNFFTDANPPVNPPASFTPTVITNAYVTQIKLNETPGTPSLRFGYYFNTGRVARDQDVNLADIFHHYLDTLDRETHVYDRQLINGTRGWTLSVYTSATLTDTYKGIMDTTPSSSCVSCRHDQSTLDSFGRSINSTLANDPGGAVKLDVGYDNNDRAQTRSNPYRSTSDPTYGIETSAFDGLDRAISQTHADNNAVHTYFGAAVSGVGGAASQLCTTTTYGFGYPVLSVDEAGKKLQKWVNAFGSIIEVDEPDGTNALTLGTCYGYDVLQNNTQIAQGAENRTYSYDGISRRTSATEPESGTTNYFYTASDGSVCSGVDDICRKTDARGVTASYTYDIGTMKDRLTSIAYSDGTPTTQYFHDQTTYNGLSITYGGDRRTGMSDGSGQTAWSYDPVGNIITEKRTIGTVTETTSYTYNVDSSIASITYPSGRFVNYAYSNAQQEISVVDTTSSTNYITGATYAPHGALVSAVHGQVSGGFAGVTETYTYNKRLQIATHVASSSAGTVLSHTYVYDQGGGVNNGNIISIANNLNTGRTQSFNYDNMNRLSSAQSQATSGTDCWGNSYGYDRFGNLLNMTVTKCVAQNLNVTVDGSNHIVGMTYDAAGNLAGDGTLTYSWDAENRLNTTAGTNYTFDGDSMRVLKGTNDLYWYSAATCRHPLLGRSSSAGTYTDEFVHFNGQAIGYRDNTAGQLYHILNDHIGSARVMTNANGIAQFESDYYPPGKQRPITTTKDVILKFQGMQRDSESGLDNARNIYNSSLARVAPARTAIIPAKKSRPPAPQSLNNFSAGANSFIGGSVIAGPNFLTRIPALPSEPCSDTPSLDIFIDTGALVTIPCPTPSPLFIAPILLFQQRSTCSCVGNGDPPNFIGACKYDCVCEPGGPGEIVFGIRRLRRQCGWTGSHCPRFVIAEANEQFDIFGDANAKFCTDTKPN